MEIDSMPDELDAMKRKIKQLEIEKAALKKESDKDSKDKLKTLDKELNDLKEKSNQLELHWKSEKEIKSLERKLTNIQKEHKILKEEVTEEDIAEVVSRWTGIPVSKMLQSEMEKLARAEEDLRARVVGQDEAI